MTQIDEDKSKLKWCVIGLIICFILWVIFYGEIPMVRL